jgi:hypothetical protein
MEGKSNPFAELKVGDGLFATKSRIRNNEESRLEPVVVTKVGRKYVTVESIDGWKNPSQFDKVSGRENVDSNYARQLVISEYQWLADRKRDAVWSKFMYEVRNIYGGTNVDEANIREAAKLLNIKLEK